MLTLGLAACGGDEDEGASPDGGTASSSKEGGSQTGGGEPGTEFEPAPLRVSGDGAELREAAEAVHAFYTARARSDWDATCSRIAAPLLEKLEGLAAQTEQKGCAKFLEAFTTPMSAAAWRDVTVIDAGDLQVEGPQASLLYQGAADKAYSMPLRREDGEWKVEALMASASG